MNTTSIRHGSTIPNQPLAKILRNSTRKICNVTTIKENFVSLQNLNLKILFYISVQELLHQERPTDFQERVAALAPVLDGDYEKIKGCTGVAPGLLCDMKFFLETEREEKRKETALNRYSDAERARIVDAEIFKVATKSTAENFMANVANAYVSKYIDTI